MQSPVSAPSRIHRISRAPMSGFPRAHLICPRSSPGFHPRSLPVFSSLFHFRRPPFPGQLFFPTVFHEDPFSSPIFPKTPSLSPSPFPVFRSRFQECPIFGPVFKNARFSAPFSRMSNFSAPFSRTARFLPIFLEKPDFRPRFPRLRPFFWPWSYSIATVAVAIIL